MPAPPSSKVKEENARAISAAKSYGGINTSSVKTSSKGSTNSFGPSDNNGGGFFGGINTSKTRTSDLGSIDSFGPHIGNDRGVSTPFASGSPFNNPASINAMNSMRDLSNKAIQRDAIQRMMGGPKPYMTDRLPGYSGATPQPSYSPPSQGKEFPTDRLAGYGGITPAPEFDPTFPTLASAPHIGPSFGRGGRMGLLPQNSTTPLQQVAAPAANISYPEPSLWDSVKQLASTGYDTFTDANKKINMLGGPKNAVTLARLFGGGAKRRVADRGNRSDSLPYRRRKPIVMGNGKTSAIA